MSVTTELFVQLTCEFEDLHSLATEGQADGQPEGLLRILNAQIGDGVQKCREISSRINDVLGSE